jgi:steroid 5-alpha reductase family enzyme
VAIFGSNMTQELAENRWIDGNRQVARELTLKPGLIPFSALSGALVALACTAGEGIADAHLKCVRDTPVNTGRVRDTGRWTHPN